MGYFQGGCVMLISVLFGNNTVGVLKKTQIEEFIISGKITKFFRSTGWVTIGVDPIRKAQHSLLEEKRKTAPSYDSQHGDLNAREKRSDVILTLPSKLV